MSRKLEKVINEDANNGGWETMTLVGGTGFYETNKLSAGKKNVLVDVKTHKNKILVNFTNIGSDGSKLPGFEIMYDDFIGCQVEKDTKSECSIITLITTRSAKGCCSTDITRKDIVEHVYYSDFKESNLLEFKNFLMNRFWEYQVLQNNAGIPHHDLDSFEQTLDQPWKKNVLVFVSPKSGPGKSQKNFNSVQRYLEAAGFHMTVVITEYARHAEKIIMDIDNQTFRTYYMIMAFGGDGIINEILNGFKKKKIDSGKPMKLRVAPILGGSAGAGSSAGVKGYDLAPKDLNNALFVVTRCRFKKASYFKVITDQVQDPFYGFWGLVIGFSSDVVK